MTQTFIPAAVLAAVFPIAPATGPALPAAIGTAPTARGNAAAEGGASENTAGSDSAEAPVPGDAKAAHPDTDQSIVITGVRRPAGDVLGGVSVVDKQELQHDVRPSLGETLQSQPGVSSSSFGPTASRPILRGLSAFVAPEALIVSEDERRAFETDGLTAYRRMPLAVVLPSTTEEVSAIPRICST